MAPLPQDPRYVVVVEDNAGLREAIGQALYDEGFVPLLASCGEEAMDFMGGAATPAIIVLDLGLPGLPSWELLAKFKAHPRWAAVPVLLVSAAPQARIPEDMPIDAFLQKPFDMELLLRFARASAHGPADVDAHVAR